jgi:sugar lactone lactonase YvrE
MDLVLIAAGQFPLPMRAQHTRWPDAGVLTRRCSFARRDEPLAPRTLHAGSRRQRNRSLSILRPGPKYELKNEIRCLEVCTSGDVGICKRVDLWKCGVVQVPARQSCGYCLVERQCPAQSGLWTQTSQLEESNRMHLCIKVAVMIFAATTSALSLSPILWLGWPRVSLRPHNNLHLAQGEQPSAGSTLVPQAGCHQVMAKLLSIFIAAACVPVLTGPAYAAELESTAPEQLRCPGRAGPRPRFHFEAQWQIVASFESSALEGIGSPRALTLDRSCNLFVADSAGDRIVKYNPDGQQVAAFPLVVHDPGVEGPVGVTVDGDGNLYVADRGLAVVRKLSPAGKQSAVWGACSDSARPECESNLFISPSGVAADGAGNVYVVDEATDRVTRFSADGKLLKMWGSEGSGPGQFEAPQAIAVDRDGNVFVADTSNNRIQFFSPEGALLGQWGAHGTGPEQFDEPAGITVDRDGNVYVADVFNFRVAKLSAAGALLDQWRHCEDGPDCRIPNAGSGPGEFRDQRGLALDGQGNMYVADAGNDRVQRRIVVEVPNPPAGASGASVAIDGCWVAGDVVGDANPADVQRVLCGTSSTGPD